MNAVAERHRFEREHAIRFSQCDPAGIVFFPQYLVMVNDLNEEWVGTLIGAPYADLIGRRRIGLPTVSLQCEFSAISRMGERVTLGLSVERLGTKSITLRHGCRLGDESRMSVRQVLVTTDLDTHRAVEVPADLREAIERFRAA
jgi:4-hydroxybenzoyl-CoA thioesterase